EKLDPANLPTIFQVNWFRKDENGKFIWPGFGENMRVLQWIVGQIEGKDSSVATPIGLVPKADALNTEGLQLSEEKLAQLLAVDKDTWSHEAVEIAGFFESFGDKMPEELKVELQNLESRLRA
ncbi:MAG: phosphoenolpyruvate carboxykinase (GTP), partial [Candidatus Aquiluna sp.]|nr:phosphoenolpyruvate carboxykinase (GTP) [Aquiluna sp.]